jgi:hypothetical protein
MRQFFARCPFSKGSAMADSQPTAAELQALIGGVYLIAAWYEENGEEQRPPRAHGRYVLVDGQVVSSLFKTDADGSQSVQALYGRYGIEDGAFRYGYDFGTLTIKRPDGATELSEVGAGPPMQFDATREGDAVRLWTDDRTYGFLVTPGVMQFFDKGRLRRIWQHASV